MDTALFDYHLPADRIAQQPPANRGDSRLLVVDRATQSIEHHDFRDLPEFLAPTDSLFRNTAKVLPARLFAQRPTGGRVECLLLRPVPPTTAEKFNPHSSEFTLHSSLREEWWCLLKPGKKLPVGSTFGLEGTFTAAVMEKNDQAEYRVAFALPEGETVSQLAEKHGKMPLPPYIRRETDDARDPSDRRRYQTVYAQEGRPVAAAAPTAGLHFTEALTSELDSKGVQFHDLTLHVGMGTFKPLGEGDVETHEIHREIYEIPVSTQSALYSAPETGRRRVCIGTTSVRSVEDFLGKASRPGTKPFIDEAGLFLYPPCDFQGVDALITNFHLPKSTLLCLVSAFLSPGKVDGIDWLKTIYKEAIDRGYRFLSYGDAMLIV